MTTEHFVPTNPEDILQGNLWNEPLTRRDLLIRGSKAVLGATVFGAALRLADSAANPEIQASPIEFGFNTHIHPIKINEKDNLTLDAFKSDVDSLIAAGQKWIRFDFTPNNLFHDDLEEKPVISVFDEAISYAKETGLKIALVTNVPRRFTELPLPQYLEITRTFYKQLAARYTDLLSQNDTVQIFNEADTHHFRDYSDITHGGFDKQYLQDLEQVVLSATTTLKQNGFKPKITMNASLWGGDAFSIRLRTSHFFDSVANYLDVLSVDPYPNANDPNSHMTIPRDIEAISGYGKPIIVAEIGVSSNDIKNHSQKRDILLKQISAIKGGKIIPEAVMIYELRNEEGLMSSDREGSFGTMSIFDQLTNHMQTSQKPARI